MAPNLLNGKPYSARYHALLEGRRKLPIAHEKEKIIQTVRDHPIVLLVGETGSGKTTQLPQFLMEAVELECKERRGESSSSYSPASAAPTAANVEVEVDEDSKKIHLASADGAIPARPSRGTRIACTQPRRVAAMSVAQRVAQESDVILGEEVGYHVRFQSKKSNTLTNLLYLTDGMLLREAQNDPDFSRYSVLIIDEAHERTVDTDILLGILRTVVRQSWGAEYALRGPNSDARITDGRLRVVIMSATLDVSTFQSFFPNSPLICVPGRVFDVDVMYAAEPVTDYLTACVEQVCKLHMEECSEVGDILCFLTGQAEIEQAVSMVRQRLSAGEDGVSRLESPTFALGTRKRLYNEPVELVAHDEFDWDQHEEDKDRGQKMSSKENETTTVQRRVQQVLVLPLYGSLSLEEQQRVFAPTPAGTRKIIFSTNIAETSVTIDGVVYVVDCGYQKEKLYDAAAGADCLLPSVISKANAAQRSGRAGRTRRGKCYRTFTLREFNEFPSHTFPEVLRSSLVNTLLLLLQLGIENPLHFDFIDPPSQQAFIDAYLQLSYLGIIDEDGALTEDIGKRLSSFSFVDCSLARMILRSQAYGCASDIIALVAIREASNGGGGAFVRPFGRSRDADACKSVFARGTEFQRAFGSGSGIGGYTGDDEETCTSDHITLLRAFLAFMDRQENPRFCLDHFLRVAVFQQAAHIHRQLLSAASAAGVSLCSVFKQRATPDSSVRSAAPGASAIVRKAMLEGFFPHVAFRPENSERYKVVKGTSNLSSHSETPPMSAIKEHLTAALHRTSVVVSEAPPSQQKQDWLNSSNSRPIAGSTVDRVRLSKLPRWIFFDRLEVLGEAGTEMRMVTAVEPQWLFDVCPEFFDPEEIEDSVVAVELQRIRERHQ